MALLTEQLSNQLQQTQDEFITKSRLSDCIKVCEQLMGEAGTSLFKHGARATPNSSQGY